MLAFSLQRGQGWHSLPQPQLAASVSRSEEILLSISLDLKRMTVGGAVLEVTAQMKVKHHQQSCVKTLSIMLKMRLLGVRGRD